MSLSFSSSSYTASLRAPEGYHLPKAMNQVQSLNPVFDKFGGHPCAAGFTVLDHQKLSIAKDMMTAELHLQGQSMSQNNISYCPKGFDIPAELTLFSFRKEVLWMREQDITNSFLSEILEMDPFGQDFSLPVLAFEIEIEIYKNPKWLGNENKHLKLILSNQTNLTFFNLEAEIQNYFLNKNKNQKLWVVAKPMQNCWKGVRTIELVVDKVFLI